MALSSWGSRPKTIAHAGGPAACLSRRAAMALLACAPARAQTTGTLVAITLNGRPAQLVLDTGATRSVLTVPAVRRLGLTTDRWVDTLLRGAGDRLESHANADAGTARAGALRLFQRAGQPLSFAVTTGSLGTADGLLGGDILRHCDIAVSPGPVISLHPPGTLPRGPDAVPLVLLFPDLLLLPVTLDGQLLTALLDTGASRSLLNARGLHRLGRLPAGVPGSVQALGGAMPVRAHAFRSLAIGSTTIANPVILAAPVTEAAFDMILGMDVLGRSGFALSYAGRTLSLHA
jgi:predicted aspartyl protease